MPVDSSPFASTGNQITHVCSAIAALKSDNSSWSHCAISPTVARSFCNSASKLSKRAWSSGNNSSACCSMLSSRSASWVSVVSHGDDSGAHLLHATKDRLDVGPDHFKEFPFPLIPRLLRFQDGVGLVGLE